ncbi:hypothetical protein NVIE_022500 [Nitrososphaera viennensis EN76]|uniref:Uncharacterized protein n=1 Tax=Nitrososphaera viennensis EN76 TaxID=926571 RepID=A0A060HSS0_9ARCH|nr:hypothetical protein NVIE_022500 [Nitrososphaera viennensis EN76]
MEKGEKEKREKEFGDGLLTFFPALAEHTVLVQRDWLSWGVFHRPHPEYSVCWAHTDACSVGDASLWIEDKCLTPLPSFHRLDPEYIWTESGADFYAERAADASLLIDVWKYSNWHLLIH